MDTLISGGEHRLDSRGLPVGIFGIEEVVQQAMIRLSVKRGSIPYDKELGSRLYQLVEQGEELDSKALAAAKEALRSMKNVDVISAECGYPDSETLAVVIKLKINSSVYSLEVRV